MGGIPMRPRPTTPTVLPLTSKGDAIQKGDHVFHSPGTRAHRKEAASVGLRAEPTPPGGRG